jgi:hypothetical protein
MAKNSAYTSTRQIPAAFKIKEAPMIFGDGFNLDYGGGKYDDATIYLRDTLRCTNAVYDPFNRTPAHNISVLRNLEGLQTITLLNVLNVIQDKRERIDTLLAIRYIRDCVPTVRHILIQVYEGDKTGIPSTGRIVQRNMPVKEYIDEIQEVLGTVRQTLGDKKNILRMDRL